MGNFTGQIVANVSELVVCTVLKSGKKIDVDKNGLAPWALTVLSGKCPLQSKWITGTIAQSLGLVHNQTYALQIREVEANDHGRQFIVEAPQQLTAVDRIMAVNAMGAAQIFDANAKVESTEKVESEEKFEATK